MSSIQTVTINCSVLAYKTAEVDEWIRLAGTLDKRPAISPNISPNISPDTAPNIRMVIISTGGLQLIQWHNKKEGLCKIAFKVTSANVVFKSAPTLEKSSLDLECQGVEVISCSYESKHGNEAAGMAAAKLLPLSISCQSMTALKLTCRGSHIRSREKSCLDRLNWATSTISTLLNQAPLSIAPKDEPFSESQSRTYEQEVQDFTGKIADSAEKKISQLRALEEYVAKRKRELDDEHIERDAALVEQYKPIVERMNAGLEETEVRVDRKRVKRDFSPPSNEGFILSEESTFSST